MMNEQGQATGPGRKRILVVDDDPGIQNALSSLLADQGFEVETSRDGAEALNRLRQAPTPDVILLDLMMPVMDGWEFRAVQRADPSLAEIPVIAMSADSSAKAAAVHAECYLRKPLRAEDLLVAIERVLLSQERKDLATRLREAERVALLGTVAAGVGHEINNPLAYVAANLDLLEQSLTEIEQRLEASVDPRIRASLDEMKQFLRDIRIGVERVRLIVRRFQELARTHADEPQTRVDLRQVALSSLLMAAHELRHRARVDKRLGEVPPVLGQEHRLGQVVLNLLLNAAQALTGSSARNEIRVTTRAHADEVVLEVTDTGQGIAAADLPHVFEPFFTTKGSSGGMGLGLAISRTIVESHGGRLEVESQPGVGSTFRMVVPAARPMAPVAASPKPHADAWRPVRRGRVLVVDDEQPLVRSLVRALGGEFTVVGEVDPRRAVERLGEGEPFDVVVCDLMMPVLSGQEFHAEVERRFPDLAPRIVFLTGGAFTEEARAFCERLSNPVIKKPFELDEIRTTVRALVAGTRKDPPDA